MDSLIGIKGPDFVIIAADSTSISGISRIKHDEDKILSIDGNKLIGRFLYIIINYSNFKLLFYNISE